MQKQVHSFYYSTAKLQTLVGQKLLITLLQYMTAVLMVVSTAIKITSLYPCTFPEYVIITRVPAHSQQLV